MVRRREVLKLMAASAPALASARWGGFTNRQTRSNPTSGVPGSVQTLNVVFEGPMVFLMENPFVRVFVPRVAGHRYRIENQEAAAATFLLNGAAGPGDAAKIRYEVPQGAEAFRVSASQFHLSLALGKDPYFTFVLPAPNRVVALTARDADIVDAFGNRRSAVMPTSYAFVYDVADGASLSLGASSVWNPRNRVVQDRFTNLVVAAGLSGNGLDPMGEHAHMAFGEAVSYFPGLKMEFISSGEESQVGSVDGLPQELLRGRSLASRGAGTPRLQSATFHPAQDRPKLVLAASVWDCTVGAVTVTAPPPHA